MAVRIRPAQPADLPTVQRVVSDSWRAAYADLLPPEALAFIADEQRFLPLESLERVIETEELSFLVALIDGEVVGEIQFAVGSETHEFVATDQGETQLQSLYVDPDHWRAGVGSKLADAGLERVEGEAVLVEVLTENRSGRQFYRSAGFEPIDEHLVELFGRPYPSTIMRRSL